MTQIWKDVRDYKGLYQVSNLGRVRSLKKNGKIRILKTYKQVGGYCRVILCKKDCRPKTYTVHRLVFEAFYRRLLPNEDCHHINQIRDCNISTNLVAKDEKIHMKEHWKERKLFEIPTTNLKYVEIPFNKNYIFFEDGQMFNRMTGKYVNKNKSSKCKTEYYYIWNTETEKYISFVVRKNIKKYFMS